MSSLDELPRKLWEHQYPLETNMAKFMRMVNRKHNLKLQSFNDLYNWSVADSSNATFWLDAWEYSNIIHEGSPRYVCEPSKRMDRIPKWFSGVRVNFAENVLYNGVPGNPSARSTKGKEDSKIALTEVREGCTETRDVTWASLRGRVGRLASAMKAHGMRRGDRAAVVASNSVDTMVVLLAVTAIGGMFSSSSTDMGTKGILDRLTQIKPKWVFVDDAALYNGKRVDLREKMGEIEQGMADVQEFEGMVSMPRWEKALDVQSVRRCRTLNEYLSKATTRQLSFERVEFNDPFVIVYSSGTTGQPKCESCFFNLEKVRKKALKLDPGIVHGTGNYLIAQNKENVLHRDLGPDTVMCQYTTTGWIMYLTGASALLNSARSVLYDGSPFQPDLKTFLHMLSTQRVTNFGTSPRYMQTLVSANIAPRDVYDFTALRSVTSTGMVLPESLFNWFYDTGFPPTVQLSNISGGTDLAGCFGQENPLQPVRVGGCQGPSLGTPLEIYDSLIEVPPDGTTTTPPPKGTPVPDGQPGDLVAPKPFPNMPVCFWPPGSREAQKTYFDAYFARFDGVWTHGDYISRHPVTGQILFHGRADGVLNPSGIRFGSGEIYSVIERAFAKEIADSLCIGQRRPQDQDESVMLFLKMNDGHTFSPQLVERVRQEIGRACSRRHIPKYVFETKDIPTTVNLKKVETPVKKIVSGQTVKPSGTLLNPEALDFYYQFAKDEVLKNGVSGRSSKL